MTGEPGRETARARVLHARELRSVAMAARIAACAALVVAAWEAHDLLGPRASIFTILDVARHAAYAVCFVRVGGAFAKIAREGESDAMARFDAFARAQRVFALVRTDAIAVLIVVFALALRIVIALLGVSRLVT